jgi:hypothetical protein
MLWMTQYQVLVMMSAKGRSPVFPDVFSSVFLSRDTQLKRIFFCKEVATLKGQGSASAPHRTGINPKRLSLLYQGYIGNILDKYSYPPFDAASHTKKYRWVRNKLLWTICNSSFCAILG